MRMMRCKAELTLNVRGRREELWPGLEVDFDRELAPAVPEVAAHGVDGDPDYRPAQAARVRVTVADAVQGREDCFEPVATPAPSTSSNIRSRVASDDAKE